MISLVKLEELKSTNYDIFDHENGNLAEWQSENRQKIAFLDAFRLCLSPTIACNRSGVSRRRYDRWKAKSYNFGVMLNGVIEEAKEELFGSVLVRATGYLRRDDNGDIEVDATGKPIYYGASDPLARALMKAGSEVENTEPKGMTIVLDDS